MTGPGICILCSADICTSSVHPVFNHVAPYRYLLPTVYLFMADIAKPDLFVCCRTWICLDITHFYEGPHGWFAKKNPVNRGGLDTIFTAVCDHHDSSTAYSLCYFEPVG